MISLRQRMLWAGVLASAAFAASAQTPPPAAGAPGGPAANAPHHRMERGDPAQRAERMEQMRKKHAEHRAQRLAALKDKLKLNTSQESDWTRYTAAIQPPAPGSRPPRMDRAEFAKLTTPQRLERIQARQAERSAMFSKRADATRSFYAALSPEQQKVFDTETAHFGPRGGHGGHGGRGHHGHRPGPAPAKG